MIRKIYLILISCFLVISFVFPNEDITRINSVTINGSESISRGELIPLLRQRPSKFLFMGAAFNGRLLKMDALTLKNYFISKGFLNIRINETFQIIDDYVDIYFNIIEGKQYFLSKVDIVGNESLSNKEIKSILGLKEGLPFNSVLIKERITELQRQFENYSKLFSEIDINPIITDSVNVSILIKEGPDVVVNKIFIEGIDLIDSSKVLRELLFKPGDYYLINNIDNSKQRLKDSGLYSLVNFIPAKVADSDNLVNIIISLNKLKQREWLSAGGFEPIEFYEGLDPKDAIGAFIEFRNRSIFKTNTNFSTKVMVGFPLDEEFSEPRIRYDIGFNSIWIMGLRLPTKINSFYETLINYEQDNIDQVERYGIEMSQMIKFDKRSYLQNITVWENFSDNNIENNEIDSNDSLIINSSIKNFQQRSFSIRYHLDKKNNQFFPKSGYLIDIYFKSTGYILGGQRNHQKLDISFQSYHSLNKKLVFASKIKLGKLWFWNDSDIDYSYEKFYLGGSSNMRGWQNLKYITVDQLGETPIGGTVRFLTNNELRMQFSQSLGLNIFYDGGILVNDMKELNKNNLGVDIGLGLTVKTPLGPVRLDYAIPRINNKFDYNNGQVQLGVQYLF